MGTNKFSERPVVLIQGSGCIDAKLKVGNVVGIDSLTKICYLKGINYCTPGLATILNGDVGISNVTLGTINNSSAAGSTVYHNYFDSSFGATILYRGTPYSISISRPTNIDPISRRAWIDFNLDGVFSANELIATETSSTNLTSTFTFSIPNNALTGLARLRVGTTYANNFIDPCATFMGEFEDYKIVLARDTVRPVITLNGADTISVQINGSYTDPGATATDNLESNASISARLQYSTDLDIARVGFYKACYDVTDYYGNQAITKCRTIAVKVDMTPPVLTMLGSTPVSVHVYNSYNDAGATATDNYSGNLTSQIRTVNGVDTSNVGTYQVIYTVQDYFGFTDSKSRTVNVIDTVKPVITLKGSSPYMHSVCDPLVDSDVISSTDNYYKNLTLNRTGNVDVNTPGTYAVTYTATDGSGNISTTLAVNIQVADITKPVLSVSSPDTVVLEVFTPFTEPAYTAMDVNCLNNNNVTVTKSALPNKNVLGTYTYTVTATDASNNTSSKSITVIYRDTQKPVVTLIGGPLVNWSLGKPWVDPGYGIIDNYYSEPQLKDSVKISGVVNTGLVGVYLLKYRVTDLSGNTSNEVEREVYVAITSVEEQLGSMAKMYPNPTNGTVNFEMLSGFETADVEFINVLGQVVFSAEISNGKNSFDLSHLSAGNYVVRLISGNQISNTKLVLTK
jgi:5-hydroxyisourate hydrolase-like protein (transthyretin family)